MKDILEQLSKYDLKTLEELFDPLYAYVLMNAQENLKYRQNELLTKFEIHRKQSNELQQRIKEIRKPTGDQQVRPDTAIKFSDTTLKILKLFSSFSNTIVFKPGQLQTVHQPYSGFYAWAILSESFPCEVPIYDLKDLLYQYSQHDNPSIDFFDDHYTIYGSGDVVDNTAYGSRKFIIEPVPLPLLDRDYNIATFSLDKESIKKINKAINKISETDIKKKPLWKFSTKNEKVYYSSAYSHHCDGIRYDTDLFTILASDLLDGSFTFIVYDQGKPKKILDGDYECFVYDLDIVDKYRNNQPMGYLEMSNTTLNLTYILPIDFLETPLAS